jgi:RNA polymerase sigma-70 factor, ECF subfamily
MNEDKLVVAGEAILSGVTTDLSKTERRQTECPDAERADDLLERLVREHSRLVYQVAYAVLRSHPDAEDVAQETYVRMLRHSSELASIAQPKAWLARIAWRIAVDRRRRRGRAQEIPLEDPEKPLAEPASTMAGADEAFESAQVGARLERWIDALPEKLRNPLILSVMDEMTPRGIASMLGINEAAVRSRIFRARQVLRERLATLGKQR